LCGIAAYVFHKMVDVIRALILAPGLRQEGVVRAVLVIAVPAATAFLIAIVIRHWAPGAGGANLARVRRAYGQNPEVLDFRSVTATFLLTPVSLGSGAPLGPEGPIVVVASGIAAGFARLLRLPRKVIRGMIPVGTAAGIAAIFNAPITGVVFALEEVLGTAEKGVLGGAIVAAVAAAVVESFLLGGRPVLAAPSATWTDARELVGFALVGIFAGIASGLAMLAIPLLKRAAERRIPHTAIRGGLAGALIGVLGLVSPSILGVGYEAASTWLNGGGSLGESGLAFGAKTIGFVVALSSGVIGGTFAPSLFMGAALGSTIGHSMKLAFPALSIEPHAYALVGMGAFFAGVLRCPIAAVLIVVEVTGDYGLILPLMLAISLGITISRRISRVNIVEQQLREEGFGGGDKKLDPLSDLRVADVMTAQVVAVESGMSVIDAARSLAGHRHHFYSVVDDRGDFLGVVEAEAIDEAARDGDLDRRMADLCHPAEIVATEDMAVTDLVRRMGARGLIRCPVVAAAGSRRLVGFVSPSDLLRARIRSLEDPPNEPER
jgi:CIC family chloride channel protein